MRVPSSTVPLVGCKPLSISFSKVVLPVPLAPSRPIRSPRCKTMEKSLIRNGPSG
ncbi:hypothetical protein D3C84_1192850 [compost metagenome]